MSDTARPNCPHCNGTGYVRPDIPPGAEVLCFDCWFAAYEWVLDPNAPPGEERWLGRHP